ncbi:MAG: hypothetical protein R2762_16440 [Bryobacteraceae bacterium]
MPDAIAAAERADLVRYVNLKLAALGQPPSQRTADTEFIEIARPLLRNFANREWQLGGQLCAADARIQAFLDAYLSDVCPEGVPRLPGRTLTLDRAGIARALSLPPSSDTFHSPFVNSYRVPQGVLHNPSKDRRTTQGVFHIAEGGFPVPADKQAVPKVAFARLLRAALSPPRDVRALPFTADQEDAAYVHVSLLLRPLVCPATGRDPDRTMEIRFFAPGSLVSNLDFVESIFGNGGDPHLPENDAALDAMHWTGHSGCVILAPHILGLRKIDLGLPHYDHATARQRRDGMCWREESEIYNEGRAFKITCRDHRGVMVTILADNYYGYCKKEVKTQISYAANLYGGCEEEHAGGALVFPSYVLGRDFEAAHTKSVDKVAYSEGARILGDRFEHQPEGYAIDRAYSDIFLVPEETVFSVRDGIVQWLHQGSPQALPLRPDAAYLLPSGFCVRLQKQAHGSAWRLVGYRPHGTFCHKPCTVSGGGKSEISKSLTGALLKGPVFVRDFHRDMDEAAFVIEKDYSAIYKNRPADDRTRRRILSPDRSLGSVIQLLTPSPDYIDSYNAWLERLQPMVRQLVFTVKRYYRPEWEGEWREHFTVDRVNGFLGHELKFDGQHLVSNYLRVGYDSDGSWRIFKLRPDFHPSFKISMEDDITASVVLRRDSLDGLDPSLANPSIKLAANCESHLFQRPDDAIHRGADRQAEADIAGPGAFLSNYEPLDQEQVRRLIDHAVEFDLYTEPMKELLSHFESTANGKVSYVVSSAHPRVVDGKPSRNPRYLQKRPDLAAPRDRHIAELVSRLYRRIPTGAPVHFPVDAVLAGRRNSPPDRAAGIPPLAVHGPIHYQELPELFMEFIASLTGRSPATTGFGSEGALTKGPFNALWPVVDLNNAVVSAIVTGYAGYTTSAAWVGPEVRVDHDVSLLVPEIWCRMQPAERDPQFLIAHGLLEKVDDFDFQGRRILAGRLGYRITPLFVDRFLGRVFERARAVFPEEMLRPEKQNLLLFAEGIDAIVETQRNVAMNYFDDGSIEAACPPLRALLTIMAHGDWEGHGVGDPEVRSLFDREAVLASDWYAERLKAKQSRDSGLWQRHIAALERFRSARLEATSHASIDFEARLTAARLQLERVSAPEYLTELTGTIGADPFRLQWPAAGV